METPMEAWMGTKRRSDRAISSSATHFTDLVVALPLLFASYPRVALLVPPPRLVFPAPSASVITGLPLFPPAVSLFIACPLASLRARSWTACFALLLDLFLMMRLG
jgi:hypothetical protein